MTGSDWIALAGFVTLCFAAAASGAVFRAGAWYDGLRKPWWNPPKWLFGPAWTVLYILIAYAGFTAWQQTGLAGAPLAFAFYVLQLALNALWSALFFGAKRIDLAFYDVVALWLSVALTIALFAAISPLAAWLMAPYLAWVTFAAALNLKVWRLNPQG